MPVWEKLKAKFGNKVKFVLSKGDGFRKYQDTVPCLVMTVARKHRVFPADQKRRTLANLSKFIESSIQPKSIKGGCGCGGAE
jgi:hypothetical protein